MKMPSVFKKERSKHRFTLNVIVIFETHCIEPRLIITIITCMDYRKYIIKRDYGGRIMTTIVKFKLSRVICRENAFYPHVQNRRVKSVLIN